MNKRRTIHQRVLDAASPDELAAAYADWADRYDADLVEEMGYQAPQAAAQRLHSHLASIDARILDAGCGTGLVGEALQKLGYRHLVGLDYSADMLARAQRKKVYEELMRADLTQSLDLADDQFDAVICVGTFTLGHVGPQALAELLRVVAGGGLLCFTVREEAWTQDHYHAAMDALVDRGDIEVIETNSIEYIEEEGSRCRLCVVRVC